MNRDIITEFARSIVALADGSARVLGPLACAPPRDVQDDARLLRLRQTVWRLRRAYNNATSARGENVIAELISRVRHGLDNAVSGFPLWIDLIETLAQEAERRFGARPGLGAYKAAQVKAAIEYLISRTTNASFLALQLDPTLVSAVIDLTIDFVVALLNRESLWASREAHALEATWTGRLWNWAAQCALTVFGRMHAWFAPPAKLSPAMRASVERIITDAGADPFLLVRNAVELVSFVATHRKEVAAIAEIISSACSEAETFQEMSGADKQAYARDLVLVLLEEEYGIELTGTARGIFAFVVDRLIDSVVRLFNKRGAFRHDVPTAA